MLNKAMKAALEGKTIKSVKEGVHTSLFTTCNFTIFFTDGSELSLMTLNNSLDISYIAPKEDV